MIDWSKPLRTVPSRYPAGYMINDMMGDGSDYRAVCWRTGSSVTYVVQVDKDGKSVHPTIDHFGEVWPCGKQMVENVPEEPKDHLHVYQHHGVWAFNSYKGERLQTKEFWDKQQHRHGGIVVKVQL